MDVFEIVVALAACGGASGAVAIWLHRLLEAVQARRHPRPKPLRPERRFTVPRIHDFSFALTEDILAALAGSVPPETMANLRVEFYAMIREAVSRHEERARLERRRLRPLEKEE
jgi:hypothetical protein